MNWDFAERLEMARNKKGWSQKVLADRSGLHPVQINKLLNDRKVKVQAETVRKLAQALDVSSDFLLGLSEDMESEQTPAAMVA